MITGKVLIENEALSDVAIFESGETGVPLKKNNNYNAVKSDNQGNYSINVPIGKEFFLTYKFTGTNGATLPTNRIPAILNLASNLNLDNVDVIYKKPKYYWLLLLIPIYFLIKKK
jgi:hypothetical protein